MAESTTVGLEPEPWTDDAANATSEAEAAALVVELRGMKLGALARRAGKKSVVPPLLRFKHHRFTKTGSGQT
eukprot:COSAG06_NODE_15631_length_1057_cov_0.974948_2_plen_72_part_00